MQLRFLICIPVYNHSQTVVKVVEECLKATDLPVIIVDDGSEQSVEEQVRGTALNQPELSLQLDRVIFIRHEVNSGKGAALQTAFASAVKKGFTHLITLDADGQHSANDIEKLVQASYQNPWAMILGDRQMQTQNVPASSVFGKAFSNFWVKYETDQVVGDSQSGFRIYPLFFVQTMKFLTKRYDFEIEVITRLIWKKVEIISVPITVRYFAPAERVTHFNKFKDNLRLTILNTILVTVSMFQRHDSALKSSVAVGLGVFVGCWPIYGLHTGIVVLLALLFRLNFIYLWIGTQISIPPMVPLLFPAAQFLGNLFLSSSAAGSHDMFQLSRVWITGFGLLGLILGVFFGLLTWILKWMSQKKLQTAKTKISVKSKDGPGVAFMRWTLQKMGLGPAYFCLWFIVPYYYLFSRKAHRSATEYWRAIQPQATWLQRQKKIFQQLFVFAQILVDRAYQKQAEKNQFQMIEGEQVADFFKHIQESRQGHVIVQSHVGGWEIAMAYFRRLNLGRRMMVVMYGIEGGYEHSSIQQKDEALKITHFNLQQDTIMQLRQYLNQGDVVGLMGDRPVGRSYELVPFFGRLALFDSSAVRLALMCEAQMSYIFCFKDRSKKYFINTVRLDLQSSEFLNLGREEKTLYILKKYVESLEKHLQLYPEQWFNFYSFWSEKLF